MMKYIHLLALWLLPLSAFGQNWAPFTRNEKFNFRHADSSVITQVIWVDSVKILGTDSVFFLNRVVQPCTSCAVSASGVHKWTRNKGQFLQKTMRKKLDGQLVFQGERTFTWLPQADVGQSWLYDTLLNITATVISKQPETVFGTTDLVKTIALSNGFSIRLSESHGLLSFPENATGISIELVGIEGRKLGEQLPAYQAIFDFQPGDVFQYKEDYHFYNLIGHKDTKYTVLTRQSLGNALRYTLRRNERTAESNFGNPSPPVIRTDMQVWTFTPDSIFWLSYAPQQLVPLHWLTTGNYARMSVWEKKDWGLSKGVGRAPTTFLGLGEYPDVFEPTPTAASDSMAQWFGNQGYAHHYSVGFGETFFGFNQPHSQERWLTGAVKNGDTIGVVLADFVTTSTEDISTDNPHFRLKKNPCDRVCEIEFLAPLQSPAVLQVWNSAGQLVWDEQLPIASSGRQLPITDFPPGVYWVHIKQASHIFSQKAVFLH